MNTPPDRVIRAREVVERLGVCKATLYSLVRKGRFPSPISLGPRAVGWRQSDIDAWLAARVGPDLDRESHWYKGAAANAANAAAKRNSKEAQQ